MTGASGATVTYRYSHLSRDLWGSAFLSPAISHALIKMFTVPFLH
jgi:hypothetical protein